MKLMWIALLSLALFTAGASFGQRPAAAGAAVSGVVVESGTGRALPKSSLELRSADDPARRYPGLAGEGGQFSFSNIPAGRYMLTASHTGYMHAEYGQRGPNGRGLTLVLAAGAKQDGIRLTMAPSAAISGHVFGANGKAAAYVQVQALRISYPRGVRTLTVTSSTVTDDLGAYRLYGLPAGQYVLTAQTNPQSLGIMPVLTSATPPVPGTVMFESAHGPMQYDADPANQNRRMGESSLTYFPGVADAREARVFDLGPGADVSAVDTTTAPVPSVAVSGVVGGDLPANAANASISVTLAPASGPQINPIRVTAQRGAFTASLAPGAYVASAMARGAAGSIFGYAPVDARPGATAPISINMTPSTQLNGHVAIEGRTPGETDAALAKVRIVLNRNPPLAVAESAMGRAKSLTTGAGGSLSCPAQCLIDGDYELSVSSVAPAPSAGRGGPVRGIVAGDVVVWDTADPPLPEGLRGLYVKSVQATNAEVVNGSLRIPTRVTGAVKVEIVLSLVGGEITGVARNGAGEAQSNVTVAVVPEQLDRQSLYKNVVTDAEGRFRFEGIAPGVYRVFCWEDIQMDDWRNPAFITAVQDRGKTVRIDEAARESMDVTMIPARE